MKVLGSCVGEKAVQYVRKVLGCVGGKNMLSNHLSVELCFEKSEDCKVS